MAGNSQRKGAKRNPGSKKGATVGSGGQKSKGLRAKGPTPRAHDRGKAAKRAGSPGARAQRRAPSAGTASRPVAPARGTAGGQAPQAGAADRTGSADRVDVARVARSGPARTASVRAGAQRAAAPRGTTQRGSAPRAGSARGGSPRGGPARTAGRVGARGGPKSAREGNEVVVGRNSVVEALRAGVPATALYVAERIDADDRVKEAIKLAADRGLPLLESPRAELDRFSSGSVHQGMALHVPPYAYAHPDDLARRAEESGQTPLLVALDSVTDPRNLGAVLRSAAAFGAHGVVIPERRSAGMSAGAWKASAGAATRVPVARATNLTRQLDAYRSLGYVVVGLAADGPVQVADLEVAVDPLVVVVGSEDQGLSRLVERSCDVLVRIPMASGTESLNAGVAAGIVLYEVARRRSAR